MKLFNLPGTFKVGIRKQFYKGIRSAPDALVSMKQCNAIRVTAWLTVFIYVITNDLGGFSQAHAATAAPPHTQIQLLKLDQLKLPNQFGEVVESSIGKSNQSVIIIQDAHSIPDAQKNLLLLCFDRTNGLHR